MMKAATIKVTIDDIIMQNYHSEVFDFVTMAKDLPCFLRGQNTDLLCSF